MCTVLTSSLTVSYTTITDSESTLSTRYGPFHLATSLSRFWSSGKRTRTHCPGFTTVAGVTCLPASALARRSRW
jgi:hypothetical protein